MSSQKNNLHQNESGQVAYSTLFILLSLVVAGAVFTTTSVSSQADIVQKVMVSLALALFPILVIVSSTLWLFGKPADELSIDTNS
jgi:inner membrane protein involved in colicin E2 resistance